MTTNTDLNDPNLDGDAYSPEGFIRFSKTAFLHSGNTNQDEDAKLILSLAAFYNQIKDLQELIVVDIEKLKSVVRGYHPKAGHLVGRYEFLSRMLYGYVHELLVFLEVQSHRFESASFAELVDSLDQETQESWKTLLDAARGRRSGKGLERVLLLVRNNASFHIQDPDNFAKGLELSIVGDKGDDAFLSEHGSMAASRFYFADVAVQYYVKKLFMLGPEEEIHRDFMKLVRKIGFTLYNVVSRFLVLHIQATEATYDLDPTGKTVMDKTPVGDL